MNSTQRQAWLRAALDMAFSALAASDELREKLVFKGARVLALRLGGDQRASYDLDANLLLSFARKHPTRDEQAKVLGDHFRSAISSFAETQDPVRYEVLGLKIEYKPRNNHPLGFDAFFVKVTLRDFANEGIRGLPNLEFDVAAPEELGDKAIAPLQVGDDVVYAYTLERIAGEKMRAFLSSLPAYREKVKKPGKIVRVKDLYDLAKILVAHPLDREDFWRTAAEEFRLACSSRYMDCIGMDTFSENIDVTEATYRSDPTLPKDVDFPLAWKSLSQIVEFFGAIEMFPLLYPLPEQPMD
jgi:hypothetical protein